VAKSAVYELSLERTFASCIAVPSYASFFLPLFGVIIAFTITACIVALLQATYRKKAMIRRVQLGQIGGYREEVKAEMYRK